MGRVAIILSPSSSLGRRFTIGFPLDCREPTGTCHAFREYIFPRLVKKSTLSWVMLTKRSVTTSSSLVSMPINPSPPRRCCLYVSSGMRFMYPSWVIMSTISSLGIRSSMSMSRAWATISVRRSSPYLSFISRASALIMPRMRASLASMSSRSRMSLSISWNSSWMASSSIPVSFCRRMSRIALACSSSRSKRAISPALASSGDLAERMMRSVSSRAPIAFTRPCRMWSRFLAWARSYLVRRTMTSCRCWMNIWSSSLRVRTRGWLFTKARLMTPKVTSIWVCW